MSAEISTITELPKEIIAEVKTQAQPATKDGIVNQLVGFAIGVPLSMFYDYLYNLMASKVITNEIARDVIKVVMPLGIGVAVHVAKVPFGNLIAGTAYAVALISLGKIVYTRVKGLFGKTTEGVSEGVEILSVNGTNEGWGVQ